MAGVAVAAAIGGAAVVGGITSYLGAQEQASAAEQAANKQAESNAAARELQYKMFQEQKALQQPWYDVGVRALPKLEAQANAMPGAFTGQVNLNQDPGYAFRLAEGNRALNQSAAQRGGLISGNALKAAQRYGQEMGSQEYGNAYQRALDVYNSQVARETTGYNRLANLAGIGQVTGQQIGSAGTAYGNAAAANLMSTGESQANSLLAQGNARASQYGAIGNAIGGVAGAYGNYLTGQQNQSNFDTYMNVLSGMNR
jgi:hypothetical protein